MKRRNFLAGAISSVAMSRAVAQTSVDNRRLAIFSLSEPIALMHGRNENRYYRALFGEGRATKSQGRALRQGTEHLRSRSFWRQAGTPVTTSPAIPSGSTIAVPRARQHRRCDRGIAGR
jgi:hypothetical protein